MTIEIFGAFEKNPNHDYILRRTDKHGTQYITETFECGMCHGTGYLPHYAYHCNGICFDCNGSGKLVQELKVYTEEYGHSLQEKRVLRTQKKMAEQEAHKDQIAAERSERSLTSCMSKHCRECETCRHRSYCSLLSEAQVNFSNVEKTEFRERILNVDTTEVPKIITLEGEPCRCSGWFDNNFGGRSRCITKPDGTKIYITAVTDRGLAKYGLKNNPEAI